MTHQRVREHINRILAALKPPRPEALQEAKWNSISHSRVVAALCKKRAVVNL